MCNQSLAESFFLDQCFLLFASTNRHHAMGSDTESLGGEECDVLPKQGGECLYARPPFKYVINKSCYMYIYSSFNPYNNHKRCRYHGLHFVDRNEAQRGLVTCLKSHSQ